MGRIIGDFTALQLVDIAVDPGHQGRGLGRLLMEALMGFVRDNAEPTCFVNLFADVDFLYGKFGFVEPSSTTGMRLDWSRLGE